jgi:hypothetical protein
MIEKLIYIIPAALIVGALIFFLVMHYRRKEQQRVEALRQLAPALNCTFSEKDDKSIQSTFSEYDLFSHGNSKKVTNVFTGTLRRLPILVFDYQYVVQSGESSHQIKQTVLVLESEKLQLPRFLLRPKNLMDKVGKAFGRKNVELEAYPEFSKRYYLNGPFAEIIRNFFSDHQVAKYYEDHPGLSTEGNDHRLMIYRASKTLPAEDIQSFLEEGYNLYNSYKN